MSYNMGGLSPDITMKVGTGCNTTTSQYFAVGGDSASTSFTPGVLQTSTVFQYVCGFVQTRNTANSASMVVRVAGISKCVLNNTITAFQWAAAATATGAVCQYTLSNTGSTVTTANCVYTGILGQVIETGVTNQIVEIIVRPSVAFGLGLGS